MKNIITTTNLSKFYGNTASVKDLDLTVPTGSIYGFLGPNGAGKSTTMKMLLGLAKPTTGTIKIFNKELTNQSRMNILSNIGSLIESPSYYGHLTGYENLQIIQKLRNIPEQNIKEALSIVRLSKEKDKKVSHYSLGMKQRLGLAGALISKPKLLILDEPTNGLDPAGIQEIRELICSLPSKYGMTIMISSHLLSEMDQMATYVGIIQKGELLFQDSLEQLHNKSKHHIAIKTLDNEKACNCLSNQSIPCKVKDGYVLLNQMDNNFVVHCSNLLVNEQIGILRIEEQQKSLEDIFLNLTGGELAL